LERVGGGDKIISILRETFEPLPMTNRGKSNTSGNRGVRGNEVEDLTNSGGGKGLN